MSLNVGVKYCGHCQPRVPMSQFARDLRERLPEVNFTRWDDFGAYSVLLVLNACPVQCAQVPEVDALKVMVSSQSLNFLEYNSYEELLQATANLLNNLAAQSDN